MAALPPKKSRAARSPDGETDSGEEHSDADKHGTSEKHSAAEKHAGSKKHKAEKRSTGEDSADKESGDAPAKHRPRAKRRRRLILPLLLVLLLPAVALVGAGPWVASHSGLLDRALTTALSGAGSIHVGSASLNWWAPVVLSDVEIRDPQGQPLAEIGSLTSDNPLWALALRASSPGRFTVSRPTLHLVLRENGSNLEDALATLSHSSGSSSLPAVELALSDGTVTIEDTIARRQFSLEHLSLNLNMLGSSQTPLEAAGSAVLPSNGQSGVKFELHAKPQTDATGSPLSAAQVVCDVEALPLSVVQPLLRRVLPEAEIEGQLTGKLEYTWGDGPDHLQRSLQGDMHVTGLGLAAAALGSDRFQLSTLHAACQLVQNGVTLQFKQLTVESDVGQVNVLGQARLDDLARPDVLNTLAHEAFQLTGQLDLAQLARLLPSTLRLRQGTEITFGSLGLSVTSAPADTGGRWQARLEGSNLAGLDNGRQVSWQAPLVVEIAAHDSQGACVVDAAHCESSFLEADAAGTLDNLTGSATFDLARLAAGLGQFVDLAGVQFAGAGKANFSWQRGADQAFTAAGSLEAQNLRVALAGRPAWQEPVLSAQFQAAGTLAGLALKQLEKFSLQLAAAQDRLTAELAQPVADFVKQAVSLRLTWQGPLAGLLVRAAQWVPESGWDVAGDGNLSAVVSVSGGQIAADQVTLAVDRLHVWHAGLFIDEPRLDFAAAATFDVRGGQINVSSATATAGNASVQLSAMRCALSPDKSAVAIAGNMAYKADATQLARWIRDPRLASAWNLGGLAAGQGQLKFADGLLSADVDSTVDSFEVVWVQAAPPARSGLFQPAAAAPQPMSWREPQISVALHAVYDSAKDVLQIAQAQIAAAALRCALAGTVANLSAERNLDLKGEVEYDWQQLLPLLQAVVGPRVTIAGHETRPFTLAGPWPSAAADTAASLQRLTGSGGFGWSNISLYGLPVGPGQVIGNLAGGVIQFQPLDLDVSQGFLHINEQLRIVPVPGELWMAKGRLVDQVTVTPDVCASALKYVVPILSEVTQAEGTFSIDIEGGRVPFGNPAAGDVVGHLVTAEAQVQAGPIAQQFVLLARQLEALILAQSPDFSRPAAVLIALNNENIDFRLVGGRVYHRNLKFQVGALQITTQGSVGLDDTLELLAEVGIADALLANRPLLSGLLGHPLQIPLTGTLGRPHLDLHAVEALTGQMVRNVPAGILDGLHNEMQKLIPRSE